jgi:hypothetical protein
LKDGRTIRAEHAGKKWSCRSTTIVSASHFAADIGCDEAGRKKRGGARCVFVVRKGRVTPNDAIAFRCFPSLPLVV